MRFAVLSATADREEWDALIARLPLPLRDVHLTSAYGRIQHTLGGMAIAAVLEGDHGSFVLQPFVKRVVPYNGYSGFDLVSPYGFGGPVSNVVGAGALRTGGKAFRLHFREWCRENIISEFTTVHPLLASHQVHLLQSVNMIWTKEVVVIDLENFSEETVHRRVRRGLKTARKQWVVAEVGRNPVNYLGFADLYQRSMQCKKAAQRWYYGPDYFSAHDDSVGARWFYIDGHRALLTIGVGENAYAHFLGSDSEHRHSGLDDLLYFEAAMALKKSGVKWFHLGGGLTNEAADSLLAFKSGFSDLRYMVGNYSVIHDRERYTALEMLKNDDEVSAYGRRSMQEWFPAYRREFV